MCIFCKSFVFHPVEVQPCKSIAYSICCNNITLGKTTFQCPGCSKQHEAGVISVTKISSIAEKLLREMFVKCLQCGQHVSLEDENADCNSHNCRSDRVTLEDIVNQPLNAEPTNLEKKAVINVVSRLMHQSDDNMQINLTRRGTISII